MLYNAQNGQIEIKEASMDYIKFGTGDRHLVMIPGLGDGLKTVKGMALPMAFMYREFAKDFTVWLFSRKQPLEDNATTETMAADLALAMNMLHIPAAVIVGVSQGGMIAQWLAIDYPHLVDKLVLVVTMGRQNNTVQSVVGSWIEMARKDDFATLTTDNFEKSYSEKYLKKYRPLYPVIVPFMKPADKRRFIIQAQACLTHNAWDKLDRISAPTLIIAGSLDKIVGCDASVEMAQRIKNSRLLIYKNYGHALYEEAKDFNSKVKEFAL